MKRFLLLFFAIGMLLTRAGATETIHLMWDACTDTNVAGYVVYHGPVGSGITNSTVLDNSVCQAVVSNLMAGTTYFFFVTAYDAQFLESDPSNVIFDTPLPTSGETNQANAPPHLMPIASKTIVAGQLLTFTATATDTNVPFQVLTFSLAAGAPVGVSIHPMSGVFTWTPNLTQGGNSFFVTVQVTDNGSPVMSDAQTVFIVVTKAIPSMPVRFRVIRISI